MSRTRYARSGALRIAYELRGTLHWRRPWLVLIQGMGLDRRGWGRCCAGCGGTLVLHGGADAVVDPRNGRLLAARIPGARLVTFPGLGHLLFWEDPDGFAAAVASFLLGARPGS